MQRLNTLLHPYTYTSILLCFGKMYVKKPCDLACKHLKSRVYCYCMDHLVFPVFFRGFVSSCGQRSRHHRPSRQRGPQVRAPGHHEGHEVVDVVGPVAPPGRDPGLVARRPDAGPSGTLSGMAAAPPRWPLFPWSRKQTHASGGAAARLASSPGRQPTQTPEEPRITGFWDRFPEHCEYVIRQTCRLGAGALLVPPD